MFMKKGLETRFDVVSFDPKTGDFCLFVSYFFPVLKSEQNPLIGEKRFRCMSHVYFVNHFVCALIITSQRFSWEKQHHLFRLIRY